VKFGSVCSGIEAASVAWHPLGWQAEFVSEIEKFPCAVLEHHYPAVPNYGDMTKFKEWPDAKIDVLVGGTPCQSFSIAGLRGGLNDPRGNLMLTYLAIADRYRPEWLVWENVPGVLSSNRGKDFGTFLGALGQLGYGFAYRILDAQYFGVPQRRRRVFVVANLRDWRRAAAVLFERESLRGDSPPSREAREDVAGAVTRRIDCGGVNSEGGDGHLVAHSLRGEGFDASEDGTGRGTPLIPLLANPLTARMHKGINTTCDEGQTMVAFNHNAQAGQLPSAGRDTTLNDGLTRSQGAAVAFSGGNSSGSRGIGYTEEGTPPLRSGASGTNQVPTMQHGAQVRRLTPRECERLQGFPDDYTLLPGKAPDGPRYKALGNSMAVPVMRWIGQRIQAISELVK